MRTSLTLVATAGLLAACAVPTALFTGELRPTKGTCDSPGDPVLQIRASRVTFSPNGGALILPGQIDPSTGGIAARLDLVGAEHKQAYAIAFRGQRQGDLITGDYATPRCRAHVVLHAATQ